MSDPAIRADTQLKVGFFDLNIRRLLGHFAIFAAFMGLWEYGSATGGLNPLIMPAPSKIALAIYELYIHTGTVYWHLFVTLVESLSGFVIGVTIGVSLATAAALNPTFRRYAAPYVIFFDVTPGLAVTPILIAWFGFGWSSKIAIATLICFFPPFVNTFTGLVNYDRDAGELFRSLKASRSQIFWKLMLPGAMPFIMAGLKTAVALALIGAVVGEFVSASEGIGILMQRFSFSLDAASSIAALLSLSALGLLLFTLMEFLDSRIIFWRSINRMEVVSRRRAKTWRRKA